MARRRFTPPIALVVLGFAIGCATAASRAGDRAGDFVTVELAAVGMDDAHRAPVVLLRDPASGQVLPILVGVSEAHAIARVLYGIAVPRPMTHDLLAGLVRQLGAEVLDVQVHGMREGIYLGRIRLRPRNDATVRDVDSRPSDALALALRLKAPIRVRRTLLRDAPDGDIGPPDDPAPVVETMHRTRGVAGARRRA